jgi:predicted cupin superfamily sugar epimerase
VTTVTEQAERVIAELGLQPHLEGGHYAETYRHDPGNGERGAMTAIFYLLRAGETSAWHRLRDADEIWHHYAGAPLELSTSDRTGKVSSLILGSDVAGGQRPQIVVPVMAWQSAHSLGDWTLAGCTVAPAFDFAGFEMAPAGWQPDGL